MNENEYNEALKRAAWLYQRAVGNAKRAVQKLAQAEAAERSSKRLLLGLTRGALKLPRARVDNRG